MKKILSFILIAAFLFCAVTAQAEVPSLSEKLFKYTKSALGALASGEYDKLVSSLPFSGLSPSADEWRNFAQGSFSSLSGKPQSKYAVAYWTGHAWKIAVPVAEPSSDHVETFVLISEDGSSFSGYGCTGWGRVKSEYQNSSYVCWNEEYNASTSVVIESDEN